MRSEAAARADFSAIRYGQVWEDADVLLDALDVRPGTVCLSIASAGDNALALLTRNPARVVAVDLSPAQLACLELRMAAFRTLTHQELLELIGSRPSEQRLELYRRCRPGLSVRARELWDARPQAVAAGIGGAGKFERYFELFRTCVLPLIHNRESIGSLLQPLPPVLRRRFYSAHWNTARWRMLFRIFFSRAVMGRLGRDPEFFRFVEGGVADRFLARTEHALSELDPSANPYLHWIVTGTHGDALPCALRPENFDTIRDRLHRLTLHAGSLEALLQDTEGQTFDCFNLSDVFEYVSPEGFTHQLDQIVRAGRPGARLVYWNLLTPRRRPESMAGRLVPLDHLAARLHWVDRAFFYSDLRIEEVH